MGDSLPPFILPLLFFFFFCQRFSEFLKGSLSLSLFPRDEMADNTASHEIDQGMWHFSA